MGWEGRFVLFLVLSGSGGIELTRRLCQVAALVSTEGSLFRAAAQCHPSLIDLEDAKNVSIPMAILASKDEDEKVCFVCVLDLDSCI